MWTLWLLPVKISQAIKFNYTSQQLITVIKKIDHYNKHCRMPVTFSGHHGMTLQFDVRNDDDRVIKNAYIICIVLFSLMSLIDCGSIFGKI